MPATKPCLAALGSTNKCPVAAQRVKQLSCAPSRFGLHCRLLPTNRRRGAWLPARTLMAVRRGTRQLVLHAKHLLKVELAYFVRLRLAAYCGLASAAATLRLFKSFSTCVDFSFLSVFCRVSPSTARSSTPVAPPLPTLSVGGPATLNPLVVAAPALPVELQPRASSVALVVSEEPPPSCRDAGAMGWVMPPPPATEAGKWYQPDWNTWSVLRSLPPVLSPPFKVQAAPVEWCVRGPGLYKVLNARAGLTTMVVPGRSTAYTPEPFWGQYLHSSQP